MPLETRDWDTRFFGYSVASAELTDALRPSVRGILESARQAGIRLIYFIAPPLDPRQRTLLDSMGLHYVGRRVEFTKPIVQPPPPDDAQNEIATCQDATPALQKLALQSGIFSRFRLDSGFQKNEFARLYGEWLASALRGDNGQQVRIAGTPEDPHGLLTVAPGARARIGLLAVDSAYRGQGIGHRLVSEAERFCFEHRLPGIDVATQDENQNACKFYSCLGFKRRSEHDFFHAWLDNSA